MYVSSPLTTGRRAFEWHVKKGRTDGPEYHALGAADFRRDVVEPNRAEAAKFVRDLRKRQNVLVIDPTAMRDLAEWSQGDYRTFWGRVIERFVAAIVFRDGWMYSSGCAYEFLVANSAGAQLLREDLTPLTLEEGRSLIDKAVEASHARGASSLFLVDVKNALMERQHRRVDQ